MMGGCDSKLTTCTVTDDVMATIWTDRDRFRDLPDGVAVVRDGDRLLRLGRSRHQCDLPEGHSHKHICECGVVWPGATPATPPADVCPDCGPPGSGIRRETQSTARYRPCSSRGGTGDRPAVTPIMVDAALAVETAALGHPGAGEITPELRTLTRRMIRAALEAAMSTTTSRTKASSEDRHELTTSHREE